MLARLSSAMVPLKMMVLSPPGRSVTVEPFMMKRSVPAACPAVPPFSLEPPKTALRSNSALPVIVRVPPDCTKIAPP